MRLRFNPRLLSITLILISMASVAGTSGTEPVDDPVTPVLQLAEDLRLAQHETWLALLHYKRETVLRRFISQVDDDRFFLDQNGKHNAEAELTADIKAFFKGPHSEHAQCLFPARWWWLKQQLAISDQHDVNCPQLEAFLTRVSHDRLYLVFPTMYLNNPGSTFGHTFLRFDDEDTSVLLSRTLNYAARVDHSDDIVSYVTKGLFGGYQGIFRLRRYYKTVQEYSDIENRDIWEYRLGYSPAEIRQLVRHVWEVQDIDFDYYFFRENCAYRLLALLDVIRPGMSLTGENDFPVYAIPVDTVRALDDAGLIQSREFRASLATKIADASVRKEVSMDTVMQILSQETAVDKAAISDELKALADSGKLATLQQANNILQFYGESSSAKAQNILLLLSELSKKAVIPETGVVGIKPDKHVDSPEKGHRSVRAAAGYGEQNSRSYLDVRLRPAFHDLLDSPSGYVDGAAINVFDTRIKWFESNNLRLESLSFFNVTSLSPVRRWQTSISWDLDFRLDRTQLSETRSVRSFISRGGAGLSYRYRKLLPFVLLKGEWNLSSGYAKGYSLLLGVQAGMHFRLSNNRLMLAYQHDAAVSGFDLDRTTTQLQWQYDLQVNHAIRVEYRRTEYDFYNDEDWTASYHYYF